MSFLIIAAAFFLVLSCGIVLFGAPFVPTKKQQIEAALDLLALKPGQTLYDLGAGDGRVAVAAAKRGLKVRGYELNFLLFVVALIRTHAFRSHVTIRWANYWRADLSAADGVFIFSAEAFMKRLDQKLGKAGKRIRLASFAFRIPGKTPVREKSGVYLYQYPIAEKRGRR